MIERENSGLQGSVQTGMIVTKAIQAPYLMKSPRLEKGSGITGELRSWTANYILELIIECVCR